MAKRVRRKYLQHLNEDKYAAWMSRNKSKTSDLSITFEPTKGFLLKEEGISLRVPRRSRLHYYENGLKNRLRSLKKEYLGETHIEFAPDDIIIDCGSNIGEFVCALNLNSSQNIFAFEPDPTEHAALTENVGDFATSLNMALWHSDENLEIFLANETGDSGVYKTINSEETALVKAVRLDSFVSSVAPSGTIRLLKLEAEGAEPEVLEGSNGIMDRIHFISVDAGPERGEEKKSTLVPVLDILSNHGFKMIDFNPNRMTCVFVNTRF
ncbi:FkbM family methyltransferase [Tropicimonas sp. IMCC34011]|uniref:FkbM family methyltransferase n=1 Tax=Tropicimonas sp. IMCC34011 TaxID=2248759 RepID=UPI001E3385A4|nr:FkbM family methyltransferase [Tropicimonas sp. IMCC34011]